MRLIICRHAATQFNEEHRVQGQLTDMPLSFLGERQAGRLAKAISRECRERIPLVYASPLSRAQQTASVIGSQFTDLNTYADTRLQEINVGIAEGCPIDELKDKFPSFWAEWQDISDVQWPGGERVSDVRCRASEFLEEMKERHPNDTIIAMTHATPAASLLALGLGLPLGGYRQLWLDVGHYSILETQGNTDGYACGVRGMVLKGHNFAP